LLVDHEAYRSQSLARGLRIMGYRVFEAGTLDQAVEFLRHPEDSIRFIITDCSTRILHRPEMIEAVQDSVADIQFVMMTDHGKWHGEAGSTLSWQTHFIEKPFAVDNLVNLIETLRAPM
jgi:DNA-binding NtrC family response regulator